MILLLLLLLLCCLGSVALLVNLSVQALRRFQNFGPGVPTAQHLAWRLDDLPAFAVRDGRLLLPRGMPHPAWNDDGGQDSSSSGTSSGGGGSSSSSSGGGDDDGGGSGSSSGGSGGSSSSSSNNNNNNDDDERKEAEAEEVNRQQKQTRQGRQPKRLRPSPRDEGADVVFCLTEAVRSQWQLLKLLQDAAVQDGALLLERQV